MIPVRDDNPTQRRAWVTLGLIVVNVAVYFLLQPQGGRSVIELPEPRSSISTRLSPENRFTFAYAAIPCELRRNRPITVGEGVLTLGSEQDATACGESDRVDGPSEVVGQPLYPGKRPYLAAFVSMFLHGGILHLGGNMLFLWVFGNNIEDRWGRIRYSLFYLIGGFAATFAHVAVEPASTIPVIGASGAIAAVMGAYLVLYPSVKITTVFTFLLFFTARLAAKWLLGFWFVSQFFLSSGSGVAWVAHVGGFVFGMAVALVVKLLASPPNEPARFPG